jgi:hypothetical protein
MLVTLVFSLKINTINESHYYDLWLTTNSGVNTNYHISQFIPLVSETNYVRTIGCDLPKPITRSSVSSKNLYVGSVLKTGTLALYGYVITRTAVSATGEHLHTSKLEKMLYAIQNVCSVGYM